MGGRPSYPCITCGGACTQRDRMCMACHLIAVASARVTPPTCVTCGCRVARRQQRCRACYVAAQKAAAKGRRTGKCHGCGGACCPKARRCKSCFARDPRTGPVSAAGRASMRDAALRRHAEAGAHARHDRIVDMWRQGREIIAIGAEVGLTPGRVAAILHKRGERAKGETRAPKNMEKRPAARCQRCGAGFRQIHGQHAWCSRACWLLSTARGTRPKPAPKPVAVPRSARPERPIPAPAVTGKRPALPCASCAYGRPSKDSESGWVCAVEAVMRCKPYGAATLYVRREQGESAC